ncbi:MAG: CRISPR-associated endonuclease Cas2 [Candidatus Woesearchaeota archaeon]
MVYDINCEKVNKIMNICREYLHHIQNSVFEGDITQKNLNELIERLNKNIKENDSIIIFKFRSEIYEKIVIGIDKKNTSNII